MAGLTVEDQCITITDPVLGDWKAELHNELESLTTALTFLSLPSTLPSQSSDMTDEQRAQRHGDCGMELYNGADYFHADANGLETDDDASRALPAGGGRSYCDADGGTSQIIQRTKANPLDTSAAAWGWLMYRSHMRSSTFCKRYMDLWRKRAASSHTPSFGSDRGGRHHGGHDNTKVASIITEVNEWSEPDIPHMPGPGYLMEDRPTRSLDEIVDAGESKTMEGYDDGCLMCRQESERGDPYGGDSEDISPYIRPSGDGSLDKVGSDDDDGLSAAMLDRDELDAISSEIHGDVGFALTRYAAWSSGRRTAVTLSEQESESNSSSSSVSLLPAKAVAGGGGVAAAAATTSAHAHHRCSGVWQ